MSIDYARSIRPLPLAVEDARITLRKVRVMLALAIASLSLAVIAALCVVPYLFYLAIITTNWSGELGRMITGSSYWSTEQQFTLADLTGDSFFWAATGGSILPVALGAVALVHGIRYRLVAVTVLSALGVAFGAIATAIVLASSLSSLT